MDFILRMPPQFNWAFFLTGTIFAFGGGAIILMAFLMGRRAIRHFRIQRFDKFAIKIHKQWREIVRGDIPPEAWRGDSMQCQIVQSIVIQEIGAATDKDRAGLQEFLRANGLVNTCIEKVQAGRGWARRRAILALGAMRVPEAIPPLSEALDDWQFDTRMAAVEALGRTFLPEAGEPIIESYMVGGLKVPPDPISNALVRCFIGRPEALLPFLRRSQGESRELLARVASELATPAMADEMLILAADPQPEVRASAAKALSVASAAVSDFRACGPGAGRSLVRSPARRDGAERNSPPEDDPDFARSHPRFQPARPHPRRVRPHEIPAGDRGNSAKHRRFPRPVRAPRHDLRPRTWRRLRESDGGTRRSPASRPDRAPASRSPPRRRRRPVEHAPRRSRGGICVSVRFHQSLITNHLSVRYFRSDRRSIPNCWHFL